MKLGLGTVQLGLAYGIKNKTGKPETDESSRMLRYAYENGIDTFDTAAAYGDSETRIGTFIKENHLQNKIKIVSKGKCTKEKNTVDESLRNLNVDCIDYYLLHDVRDLSESYDTLCLYKEEGKIKKIGVSVYDATQIEQCLLYDDIAVIQVPFNMVDNRLLRTGMLEKMKQKGIEVHARSIYLQGLLLMEEQDIPSHLSDVKPYIKRLDAIAHEVLLTRKQLLFSYAMGNELIDKVFVGCDNMAQLQENLDMCEIELMHADMQKQFADVPEKILNPSMWV